jgi:hypothetical protein
VIILTTEKIIFINLRNSLSTSNKEYKGIYRNKPQTFQKIKAILTQNACLLIIELASILLIIYKNQISPNKILKMMKISEEKTNVFLLN